MHHRIGVMHGHAFLDEEARGRRLSHAERAGETEDEHPLRLKHFARKVESGFPPRTCNHLNTMNGAKISRRKPPRLPEMLQQRQERQSQDDEMIAFDTLEQLDAGLLQLIAPHTRGDRRSRGIEIVLKEPV